MSKSVLSEAMIQASILEYLAARHIFAMRLNSGTMMSTYKEKSYRTALCAPGTADILAFPKERWEGVWHVRPLWIECKSATGKQTPVQKLFQHQVEDEGHKYIIARSIDDVEEALK
jgi:hypothetical protein